MDKPAKPYPEFPLFPHATKRWAKKIRGRLHYFGPWRDPEGALEKYLSQKDDLHAGRNPRPQVVGMEVAELCDRFLAAKERLLDAGEIRPVTWKDYHRACGRLLDGLPAGVTTDTLTPQVWEALRARLAATRGPTCLTNDITRIRCVFRYAHDAGLIPRPMQFGPGFRKPSQRVLRSVRLARGPQDFPARHIRRIVKVVEPQMRAMVLLGVNCGLGNTDLATVPRDAFDLRSGWLDFPRPKTGSPRRCPLWPRTVAAVKTAIAGRPTPHDPIDESLAFLTAKGRRWARDGERPLSQAFRKLLDRLGLHRRGLGFYCLRRTFETVAGDTLDQVAVDFIMGHIPEAADMSARYRQRITDTRLLAVTGHVHRWLFRQSPWPAPNSPPAPLSH